MRKKILNSFCYPLYAWGLVSHKLLRWLVPYFLIVLFVVNIQLVDHPLYQLAMALQITFYAPRMFDICDQIKRKKLKGLELLCINGGRADRVSRDLLKRMREVGFISIGIGVEGGNDKILRNIRKGETIEMVKQAIKDACDLGYEVTLHFVIGTPGETW